MEQMMKEATDLAMIASNSVKVDELERVQEGMEDTQVYQHILQNLRGFLVSDTIDYIYVLKKEGDSYYFLVDCDSEDPAAIGEECDYCVGMDTAWEGNPSADQEITTDEWGSFLSGYAPIMDDAGNVIAIMGIDCDADTINSYMTNLYLQILVIVLLGIVVIFLGLWFIVGGVTKNIRVIVKKLDDIVHNDGDLTKKIEMNSGDEMEQIAGLFNEFIEIFRSIVGDTRVQANSIKESSIGISDKMEKADEGLKDVTGSVQKLMAMMEETSASMAEITSTVDYADEITREMNTETENGMAFSDEVKVRASELKEKSLRQKENTRALSENITSVLDQKIEEARAVEQIQSLSANIVEIASQSNLLALNASIESARAGEAGRGFAVVAEEISELAKNTKSTAETIVEVSRASVKSVNELAEAARKLMLFMQEEVLVDYDDFVESGNRYNSDAEKIYSYMKRFEEMTTELKSKMGHILATTQNVEAAVMEGNEDIAGVAHDTDLLTSSMHEVNETSKNNNERVGDLESSVQKFIVE